MKVYQVSFVLLSLLRPAAGLNAILNLLFAPIIVRTHNNPEITNTTHPHVSQASTCDSIIETIPVGVTDTCGCDAEFTGFFELEVSTTCASSPCSTSLSGSGGLLGLLFGGIDLMFGASCDFGVVLGEASVEGTINIGLFGGPSLESCSGVYDPIFPLPDVACTCTPGCDSDDPFSASIACGSFSIPGCPSLFDIVPV